MGLWCRAVILESRTQAFSVLAVILVFTIAKSNCREAIRPPADVETLVKNIAGSPLSIAERGGPPCSIDIQKELPKPKEPQPLYLIPDKNRYWLPNEKGQLEVPRGASIELYCTSSFVNGSSSTILKNTRTLWLTCLQNQTFLLGGEKCELRHFLCAHSAKYSVERTSNTCANNRAQIYRVGYNITRSRFVETMQICHDDGLVRTHYTQHLMMPANVFFQRSVPRLNFSKAGYFSELDMKFFYTQKNQREQAARLLGESYTQYFAGAYFLARGHLAAKADMIYATQQRSTFNFFNIAPQWQSFNGGQWAALEDQVHKFVAKMRLEVDCYTGTWGTMELPLQNGERRKFYLAYDENNNGLLPVPKLYYRVIVDRRRPKHGIVVVGVNNPHASMQEIREGYVICKDVQTQVSWLQWMRNNNLKKGYLYACRVNEFANVVKHLPAALSGINELLDLRAREEF